MTRVLARVSAVAALAAVTVVGLAGTAVAQLEQSEIGSESPGVETTQLVTSSAEVRRAVIGLVAIAVAALVVFVTYWWLTGRAARRRHEQGFGGRHVAGEAPRRGRRGTPVPVPTASSAVSPGDVEPRRRRVTAAAPDGPKSGGPPGRGQERIHPGWVDETGRRRMPVKVHPAWVNQAAPTPMQAGSARHAAQVHDPSRPWRQPDDGPWPRPFEDR